MADINSYFIKKSNFKAIIFSFIILSSIINSNLFGQAACTLPVSGPFFQDNGGGLSIPTAKAAGECYTLPTGAGTQTVCYRYTYPSSGNITFKYMLEYSTGAGCNNNSCLVSTSAAYNTAGCSSPTACGAAVTIKTYDNNCNFVMNNAGIGVGCGGGNFVPGQDYIVCFEVPLNATCTTTVCPIIGCSSANCGCTTTVTANAGTDQTLCGVTSTTLTGNNASPGTGTWTVVSGPNTPTITSPNSASTTVTSLISGTYTFRWTSVCATHSGSDDIIVTVNPDLVPAISSNTPVTCTGSGNGSLTVSSTGGGAPYTYAWSPSGGTNTTATNLGGGTYTVTVTGGGCTKTASATVAQSGTLLAPSISSTTPVACTGNSTGSLTASQTGGTGPFTYSWSPGGATTATISGLSANTYTVTITDAYGCIKTTSGVVTQPASAIGSTISGQSNVNCTGSATGSATVTGTGGTPNYTYSWSPGGQTTATVTGLTAGTYNVTVTDSKGCTKVQSVAITQPASSLGSTINGQSNVSCTGSATGSATVIGTGGTPNYTYSWSPGGQTTASVTGLTAGTYNVTVTDANGCTKVQSVAITQPASSLGSTVSGQSNVNCTGSATGSATVTGTGGTPNYTYSWSPGGQTTASVTGLTAGTYNVTVTDANGCTKVQSVAITQPASSLGSTISGQSNVNCTGSATGSATVTGTGGTPNYTYSWSPGGQTTASITGLTSGSYDVIITDANGCTATQTVAITQPASGVNSTTSSVNATCGNSNGTASVTATGGTPGYTYSWSPIGGTGSIATNLPAGPYNVTITDTKGCTKVDAVSVNNSGAPTVGISSQVDVLCNGAGTGTATVTATGGTGTLTYLWIPGGQTTTTVTGLTAGTYVVTVTDSNNCAQGQTIIITQPATAINSGISSKNNVGCTGSSTGSATITATGGTGTLTYLWSPGGETTATINGLTAGTYSVTVTDANGCSQQQIVSITEPTTSLTITPGSTNASCGSSDGSVSVTASGGTPNYTYNWNNGATDALNSGLIAGTYSVVVTDINGCSQTTSVTISGLPGPSITGTPSSNVTCNGLTNGTITVSANNGTLPYTYLWTPNVTTNNMANNLSANTYTVVVSDAAGCKDTAVITITEPLPMTFSLTTSNAAVCAGESLTILTTTPSGGTPPFTFTWSPAGPVVSPLVPTTYSVTVTDASGCVSPMDTILVTPLSKPAAGFDTISSGLLRDKYTFKDISAGGDSWYWMFGDGTTSTVENPYHTFPGAGTYTVTQVVTNSVTGCTDTAIKIIVILPRIIIPNVFTPNHDGINDDFWIPNTGFESFELTIYDRWGLKLFTTDEGQIRWDGRTSAGNEAPDGTYYYILKAVLKDQAGGKNYDAKGFINLVRGGGK